LRGILGKKILSVEEISLQNGGKLSEVQFFLSESGFTGLEDEQD
jgi:hypothetical protein